MWYDICRTSVFRSFCESIESRCLRALLERCHSEWMSDIRDSRCTRHWQHIWCAMVRAKHVYLTKLIYLGIQEYRHASTDRHPCSNRVLRNVALLGPPDIADTPEDPPEKQKSVRVAWV